MSTFFESLSVDDQNQGALSGHIDAFSEGLDIHAYDLALLFMPENRWVEEYPEEKPMSKEVLNRLGRLFPHGTEPRILSLGRFIVGERLADSEAALTEIVTFLMDHKVVPIIIGGSRQLNYSVYRSFEQKEQVVNIAAIDAFLNVDDAIDQGYIGRIIKEQPNYLFNYSNLGYQTYLVPEKELELAEELYFDSYRLGLLRGNIYSAEPMIRGAEILSCSMESVKSAEFTSATNPRPNGIYAEEVCQLMRYAGLTDKNKVMVLTDINWAKAHQNPSDLSLLAEMIWCYIDGFYHRKTEMPRSRKDGFLKYRVPLRDDEFQLVFYKSLNTDRWWMEVPVPPQYSNKYRKHHLIPCDYEDYLIATSDDLPERWWKAYKKML